MDPRHPNSELQMPMPALGWLSPKSGESDCSLGYVAQSLRPFGRHTQPSPLAARGSMRTFAAGLVIIVRWVAVSLCTRYSPPPEGRSQSGDDSEKNLITLCCACHATVHHG